MPPAPPVPAAIDFTMPWWLDLLSLLPLLIGAVFMFYIWRHARSGQGYLTKQSAYLDHQRQVNEKALEQNKTFEDMISRQYDETNLRADKALAQSDEAIRLHAASLEQLTEIRTALVRLAGVLEADKGSRTA